MPEELISEEIIGILQRAGQEISDRSLDTTEFVDILWFANQVRLNSVETASESKTSQPQLPAKITEDEGDRPPSITRDEPESELLRREREGEPVGSVSVEDRRSEKKKPGGGITTLFQVPAATSIPNRRLVSRAFYPLHQKVPSRIQRTLDIFATIKRSAEEEFCFPVQKPAPQRWLDVAVVIEKSPVFGIWQQTIKEFVEILQRQGAFRDVKCWYVSSDPTTDDLILQSQSGNIRNPKELILMGDRRIVLVLSDCVTPGWLRSPNPENQKTQRLTPCWQDWLSYWGKYHPVTILQMLPAPFWQRTALSKMELLWLSSFKKGALNEDWHLETRKPWKEIKLEQGFPIPIVTLNPYSLNVWAKGTAGYSSTKTAGIYLRNRPKQSSRASSGVVSSVPVDVEALFKQFMNTASLQARKLAALMSAVPVQLPIVRLIQRSMMHMDSTAVHAAEVFFSGILKRINEESDPEKRLYDFEPGIRELLNQVIPASELAQVIDRISIDIAKRAGYYSVREFRAQLFMAVKGAETEGLAATPEMLEFAKVSLATLQRLGGKYAEFVDRIESRVTKTQKLGEQSPHEDKLFWGQKLESYSFKTGQYVEEWADKEYEFESIEFIEDKPPVQWEELEFEVARISVLEMKRDVRSTIGLDLQSFYRNINISRTLEFSDLKDRQYYVDFAAVRGGQIIEALAHTITRLSPEEPTCQLFTGHIGCGKSTELLRLKALLEQENFEVVYFESSRDLDMEDVRISDILLAVARSVSEHLEGIGIVLKPTYFRQLLEDINRFLPSPVALDAQLSISIARIMVRKRESLRLRQQIRQPLESRTEGILRSINEELLGVANEELQQRGKRGLVVIVDNLDRISSRPAVRDRSLPEYLFIDRGQQLRRLNCHVIYTIPLALVFSNEYQALKNRLGDGVAPKILPMVPIQKRDHTLDSAGLFLLQQCVLARAFPKLSPQQRIQCIPNLFDNITTLNRLCLISGGHVRTLLGLLYQCLQQMDPPLSRDCIERVIKGYRDDVLLAVEDHEWEMLAEVLEKQTIRGEQQYQILLRSMFVYEYQDQQGRWFGINPILAETEKFKRLFKRSMIDVIEIDEVTSNGEMLQADGD